MRTVGERRRGTNGWERRGEKCINERGKVHEGEKRNITDTWERNSTKCV